MVWYLTVISELKSTLMLYEFPASWSNAFSAVFLISFFPTLILILIPTTYFSKPVNGIIIQNVFLSFAAGGLLGDVFIHALPHLMSEHSESCFKGSEISEKENLSNEETESEFHSTLIGIYVLIGFLLFFVSEKVVSRQIFKDDNVVEHAKDSSIGNEVTAVSSSYAKSDNNIRKRNMTATDTSNTLSHDVGAHSHNYDPLSVSCWLNIFADLLHNFTDGIAIGAACSSGKTLAIATTISIFIHEIPHEIGDFSILIKSGFSKSNAIYTQFGTAIAAFIGTFIGLAAERHDNIEDALLALTSGGFIYVATVGVIPSIMTNKPSSWFQLIAETLGLCAGIGLMILVALFEDAHE